MQQLFAYSIETSILSNIPNLNKQSFSLWA